MKYFLNKNIYRLCFLFVYMILQVNSKCCAQENGNTLEKDQPTAMIVLNGPIDGSFGEYSFYDDAGRLIKKVRNDQFESKHPIYKLNALKRRKNDTLPGFDPVLERIPGTERLQPKVIDELNSLKKFGIIVKSPEKADVVFGSQEDNLWPIISMPQSKYLINIETARILDYYALETEGHGNALLDCSYITIYNYLGDVFKEILFRDKIIDYATISDDGNFLMCSYSYTYLWDEGYDNVPDGISIADLRSKKINYISRNESKNSFDPGSVLFADGYFQATIGNPYSGDACVRIYINPYDRRYYIKTYGEDRQKKRKAIFPARSFIQFESVVENPTQFESFAY